MWKIFNRNRIKTEPPENGLHTEFRNDWKKTKLSETPYKNGKVHGVFKMFYPNGNLMNETNYKMAINHGKEIHYFENGNIHFCQNYKNGEQHGTEIVYDKETNKVDTIYNYKNGKQSGKQIYYSNDEEVYDEKLKKYVYRHFIWFEIDVMDIVTFNVRNYTYKEKCKVTTGPFQTYVAHGKYKFYHHDTEKISEKGIYCNNIRVGKYEKFNSSGKLEYMQFTNLNGKIIKSINSKK
jgi:antitoxin component YwqK of YwqJK toxin-antitoxin module